MRELNTNEVHHVAGAALFGGVFAPAGNALIQADKGFNNFLNTPAVSSFGKQFDAASPATFGVSGAIHQTADGGGYLILKGVGISGTILGGSGENEIEYHYYKKGEPGNP